GTANEAAGDVNLAVPGADSALAKGDGKRGDVAPGVGRVVIARDVVAAGQIVAPLATGDVEHVVRAEGGLEGITRRRLVRARLPGGNTGATGHTKVVVLDGIGCLRSPGKNRPECWFAELNRVPFRQRERDRADREKQQQIKRASEEMRFDVGISLFFHEAGVLS